MTYKHVVCVVDGSMESLKAQGKAAEVAKEHNAKLTYVFLANTKFLDDMATLTKGGKGLQEGMSNVGRVLLERAHEIAKEAGVSSNEEVLDRGDEASSLEAELQSLGADLLVTHLDQGSFLFNTDKNDLEDRINEVREITGVDVLFF